MTLSQRKLDIALWYTASVLPFLFLLFTSYRVFAETMDDPYITFRYAANLAAGHGPVFNIGEHVEGFTSPLHLMLCVVLLKTMPAVDILFKAKLASLVFGLVLLNQAGKLAALLGLKRWECLVAQCLLSLNTNFAIAAVNGLETTLYACLLTAAISGFISEGRAGGGSRSAGWLCLALLARPDTYLVFAALLAVQIWRLKCGAVSAQMVLRWTAVFAVPAFVLTGLRLLYYHALLPNTFYAKHVSVAFGLSHGLQYLTRTLSPDSVLIRTGLGLHAAGGHRIQLLGMLVFWGLTLWGLTKVPRKSDAAVLYALVLVLVILVLRTGGDWMPGWRFTIAFLPLLAVAQCFSLRALGCFWAQSLAGKRHRLQRFAPASLCLMLWVLALFCAPVHSWAAARYSTHGSTLLFTSGRLGPLWVAVGDYIHSSMPAGATIAYSEMGYAGFVNLDKNFLDLRGLTCAEIASLPEYLKGSSGVSDPHWYLAQSPVGQVVIRRQPDLIIGLGPPIAPELFESRYYVVPLTGSYPLMQVLAKENLHVSIYARHRLPG